LEREVEGKPKVVAVSLPTEQWWKEVSTGDFELIERIKRKVEREAKVEVRVLPQGFSAMPVLVELGLEKGKRTLVIDGGFNTINFGVLDERGRPIFVRTLFNEFGIRDLLENYFRPLLQRRFSSVPQNLQYLKQVFLLGKVDRGFEEVSVKGEKKEAVIAFMEALFSRIKGELERQGIPFEQFGIVGGITHYISQVKTNKRYAIGDEFSTVKGMRKLAGEGAVAIDFGFGDIKVSAEKLKEKKTTISFF